MREFRRALAYLLVWLGYLPIRLSRRVHAGSSREACSFMERWMEVHETADSAFDWDDERALRTETP
jgi:hypothetical protein